MSPTQVFTLDKIHVFGCDVQVLIEEGKRGKLQPRTKPGIFLGYSEQYNAYKVLMLHDLKVIKVSRDVTFNESSFSHMAKSLPDIERLAPVTSTDPDKEYVVDRIDGDELRNGVAHYKVYWKGYRDPTWEPIRNLTHCKSLLTAYLRSKMPAPIQVEHAFATFTAENAINYAEPQTFKQAMALPDREKWKLAIDSEVASLKKLKVFIPCKLPPGKKPIPCRWVFKVKHDDQNRIIKHKARVVVKGFHQRAGVDYDLTFSPTVAHKSIKLMLGIAAMKDLEIDQLDFITAFLNADMDEDIYVTVPDGFGDMGGFTVLKLNKALYGLKQASRRWWLNIDQFLATLGYHASPLDECLYMKVVGDERIYLTLYVDDTLSFYPKSLAHIWQADKAKIAAKYSITDLGECKWILNMVVERDRINKTITLSQRTYVEGILLKHQWNQCKPAKSPHWIKDLSVPPDKPEPRELNAEEHEEYRSIVGSLLYAAIITRVDIAYITGILGRYLAKPYNYHLTAAYHVLRYLRGCSDKKLTFGSTTGTESTYDVTIYTDSDWAQERDNRKSVGGWILLLNGRPIVWQSKKQRTIALSSTEAEYYALGEAVREAIYIRQWFKHYVGENFPVKILCDNQGTLHIADHSTNHNRTKHIDIQHFFVREYIRNKSVFVSYINTSDNLADILTKATAISIFTGLRDRLLT
jgi:hypothetical protein